MPMQINTYNKEQIVDLIDESKNIAVMPSKIAGCDAFSASVGLFYMLQNKYGNSKNLKFIYFGKPPENCADIIKADDISSNLTQRDLVISIDYSDTQAHKIKYLTEEDTFILKMGPIPKDFDTNRIRAKITGFDFDLIITVGARDLEDLGPIYKNLEEEIGNSQIINIDNGKDNKRFGVINILDTSEDSLSTLIYKRAHEWNLFPSKESAKALLTGMTYNNIKNS
jgi:nanoRNase/pAp phosphatase (c-di-AMP/oligoRNAs hydrolase)